MSEQSNGGALSIKDAAFSPRSRLDSLQTRALGVGAIAAVAVAVGYFTSPDTFLRPYLIGWLLCFSIACGLFALGMLNHISGGLWGVMMRRVCEASGRSLPLMLVLALPLVLGIGKIYPWANAEIVAGDALLEHKAVYLNTGFFTLRLVVFFTIWTAIALLLGRWSRQQDVSGDPRLRTWMQKLSAFGLVVWVLTSTLASVDWVMSLDPHWFSSLFGIAFVAGQGLSAFAFIVVLMLYLSQGQPFAGLVRPKLFHDYGKLMLAFVMLWAYFMVSQYLIIWSGNLPEEIGWYMERNTHGWKAVSVALVLGHFALPFGLLLSQDLKLRPRLLRGLAVWVLFMRWVDFYWQVTPSLHPEGVAFGWLDIAAPLAIGGIWLAFLVGQLKRGPVLPVQDRTLKEALAHG